VVLRPSRNRAIAADRQARRLGILPPNGRRRGRLRRSERTHDRRPPRQAQTAAPRTEAGSLAIARIEEWAPAPCRRRDDDLDPNFVAMKNFIDAIERLVERA
jgi:hypothetical protein